MKREQVRMILFFGVIGVTSSSFIIRFADQPPYALAFVRVLLTGLIAFVFLNQNGHLVNDISKHDKFKILLAGISLATHFGWWFDSLSYLPIGTSLSLTNTAPIWIAIFGALIYNNKMKPRQILAIGFIIIGSTILFIQNAEFGNQGLLGLSLALGSAIGFAIYLLIAKDLVPKIGLWKYFGLVNLSTAGFLAIWIILNNEIIALKFTRIWYYGFLLALVPGILGHSIYNWSMPKLDPIDVGVATLGEPILGTTLAWIIFNEHLSLIQLFGISFLIFAIFFSLDLIKINNNRTN